jgi:hypothetical protein
MQSIITSGSSEVVQSETRRVNLTFRFLRTDVDASGPGDGAHTPSTLNTTACSTRSNVGST